MSRKKLIIPLLLIVALVSGVFTVSFLRTHLSSGSSRETLNVLNWTSYIPDDVINDFESEYGVKVNYSTYSSNEELLAKVSSATPGTYDVVFPSDYMVELMIRRDLLAPLDVSRLENFSNLDPRFLNQEFDADNSYSLPFLLATTVFLYDETKVDRLTSYKDLINENLRNNVVLLNDQRIVVGALLNASGFDMNDSSNPALESAFELYQTWSPNVKALDSDSPKSFFITGEVDAGLIWNAEALLAQSERENLKIAYPAEGFALSMDNYCILNGSTSSDLAYKFIDFLMRDDISARIVAEYPYISPNKSVSVVSSEELDEILSRGSFVKNVGADIEKFDKLWAKML